MANVSEVLQRDRERKILCTDLAVEGAGVGNVFLGLVGIHWVSLVGFLMCRG